MAEFQFPVGVDSGGTFTDFVYLDGDGNLVSDKVPSTPDQPEKAVVKGLQSSSIGEVFDLIHGTTVATNAVLEREGARVAFVTTAGFRDLLAIGRQARSSLYDLYAHKTKSIVDSNRTFEVDERMGPEGSVLSPLRDSELDKLCDELGAIENLEAVAVSLLHAYENPKHEKRIVERLREHFPNLYVTASHEVLREIREYERSSATALNAFVGPVVQRYLERLDGQTAPESLQIFHSGGGRLTIEEASDNAVQTLFSGPAAGVVGAYSVARDLEFERIISFDMGGTSTDVSLCDGEISYRRDMEVAGMPVGLRSVDIETVGAGGGSIAFVDKGGVLRVGPKSAGARPGPACYGRGGDSPTVTDAHLFLGRIPEFGNYLDLEPSRSEEVIGGLAKNLDVSRTEAALSILDVADASMVRALKRVSVQRGKDPRRFSMIAFGGAGGMHACRLAQKMEIDRVIIPYMQGVLSAYGMLKAPRRRRFSTSIVSNLGELLNTPSGTDRLRRRLESLLDRASQYGEEPVETRIEADLRYSGQSFELTIPVGWDSLDRNFEDPSNSFHREHENRYGYQYPERSIELMTIHLTADYSRGSALSGARENQFGSVEATDVETQTVVFESGEFDVPILRRSEVRQATSRDGPVIIADYGGTTVVPAGWSCRRSNGHLILEYS